MESYTRTAEVYLADWANRPLASLTRQMALNKYRELARTRGGATANNALRHFRSVYNTAAASEDTLPPNPVTVVTQARAWEPQKRRRRLVPATALATWWTAVMEEPPLSRDLLLVALFTGMRRGEIIALRWENIDLKARTLEVPRTKNGDPLQLPLSTFLAELLAERRQLVGNSPWVFPTRSRWPRRRDEELHDQGWPALRRHLLIARPAAYVRDDRGEPRHPGLHAQAAAEPSGEHRRDGWVHRHRCRALAAASRANCRLHSSNEIRQPCVGSSMK